MTPRRRMAPAMAAWALLLTAAGCGVPAGGEPRVVEASAVPYGLLDPGRGGAEGAAGAPGAGEVSGRIALLTPDDRVTLVPRAVPAGSADAVAQALLEALTAGPTDEERARGLRSALPAELDLTVSALTDGVAAVDMRGLEPGQPADRLALTVGQVVLTATSATGVRGVVLEQGGRPVAAPDADGGPLTAAPLRPGDYADLLQSTATPTPSSPDPTATP
jgi:hypothetical protein